MSKVLHDLKIAFRMLSRRRGFAAVAVTTLALGIGANAAIFSVVNGLMLDMDRVARELGEEYPRFSAGGRVNVDRLREAIVCGTRPALTVLGVAVGLVLLIACANLANLLLARGAAREQEMAVRGAPGVATILVKSDMDAAALIPLVERAVSAIDHRLPLNAVKTLDEVVAGGAQRERLLAKVLTVFATLAVVLAGVGLYGVMAYSVTRRRHEIAIRMAIGARAADVLRMVVTDGVGLVLLGVGSGLGVALLASPLIANQLFGVSARDPLTLAAVPALLIVVGAAACAVPARRASRVEPVTVLHNR